MGKRRTGREFAVQVLYAIDISGEDPDAAIQGHLSSFEVKPEAVEFARSLIRGVLDHREELDSLIAGTSEHWRLDRMSLVDRNILRLAIYEMKHVPDVPPSVAMNEAIELAKAFGTEASPSFINGILDKAAAIIASRPGTGDGREER